MECARPTGVSKHNPSRRRGGGSRRLGLAAAAFGVSAGLSVGQPPGGDQPQEPVRLTPAQSCVGECHQDVMGREVMHGPTERDCQTCHVQGDPTEHRFYYPVPKERLCVRCHTLPEQGTRHQPVSEGDCLACHDPHGSDHPSVLLADPNRDLCNRCHEKDVATGDFVHGPVVLGACVVCHEPHASTEPALLRQNERRMCLTCHQETEAPDEPGWHEHGALDQGCTGCHDPHASDHRYQLHATAPDLCMTCHRERIEQTLEEAPVVHGAVLAEGGCSTCHEPHRSRLPNLQSAAQPDICLDCHDRKLQTESGQTLPDMKALLERNPNHHGPIREGVCTACHQAHAGEHFRLLVEEYPPEFYAPFEMETFRLCFQCHIPDLVLEEEGRGLTRFRDGNTNLHWLHVNREKGRTCRACHEVHASKRPAHVREAVPFGSSGWMLEINFEQTSRGGMCTPACHQTRTYERSAEAGPLRTGPEDAPNPSGLRNVPDGAGGER